MPSPSPIPRRAGAAAGLWTGRGASGSTASASTVASFNVARSTRSYLARLPLVTRLIVGLSVLAYVAGLLPFWDIRAWGELAPSKLNLGTLYRTNTFPMIHLGLFHMLANLAALVPLLDRFEGEHGTLTSLALFFGPFATIPAVMYAVVQRIFHQDTAIMGASVWVFLLLGLEAIRTYRANPSFVVGGIAVPTWATPLLLVFVIAVLVPNTSLLGHLCGLLVGYGCGLGYLKFLSPPERVLRWIEGRFNLLARVPHYVSVDQKTYGRFGVLPKLSFLFCADSACSPPAPLPTMPSLISTVVGLRRDPRMLKLPPYVSLLCIIVGVVSLLVLPLDSYSRHTYLSENALLPGQVHTYFGGSDEHVFRAYRLEVEALVRANASNTAINDHLASAILAPVGLKIGRQNYTYPSRTTSAAGPEGAGATAATAGACVAGENLYAILQAPRGDATEALVLVAPWRGTHGTPNVYGVALTLALARYFRRWSLWSKDIVFLFPPDSLAGPQAWVDAYHDAHDARYVSSLPRKSGALQGALALDYTRAGLRDPSDPDSGPVEEGKGSRGDVTFSAMHIVYDGVNGQLPNLDLINSVVHIAGGQVGSAVALQEMWQHGDSYADRLRTMLRGMLRQGLGAASGAHSAFMAYHVDAVTLQPYTATTRAPDGQLVPAGWQHDEMAMGRILEGTFRSLNNLLEHLHQSFFFYLLMGRERFVSIGTYLPSAMLLAANFTIMSISLWVKSGQPAPSSSPTAPASGAAERDLFLPLGVVTASHALGIAPLYFVNHIPSWLLSSTFVAVAAAGNSLLPHAASFFLTARYRPSVQHYCLIKSFSLLLLGMFLSALATLNFSLAFLIGLVATPLTFATPCRSSACRCAVTLLLNLVSPPAVLVGCCLVWHVDVTEALRLAAFAWDVWGTYTAVVVWCVWWPAWLMGSVLVLGAPSDVVGSSVKPKVA